MKTKNNIPFSPSWQQEYKEVNKALKLMNDKGWVKFPAFVQVILDKYQPQQKLAVYGTLAPGRVNHNLLEHIPGSWSRGKVRGVYSKDGWGLTGGYPAFIWQPNDINNFLQVHLLHSEELPHHWNMLDNFEGKDYRRILVPIILDNGMLEIANIYALQQKQGGEHLS